MSRTLRADPRTHARVTVPDGKSQTMQGLDTCPPRWWRKARATRPERRDGRAQARQAMRDPDGVPAVGRAMMPWFT